jgi:hypothetical protein
MTHANNTAEDTDCQLYLPTFSEENARLAWEWIQTRGGVACWHSINMSNLGASWNTPANTVEGGPTPKPTWEVPAKPQQIVTKAENIKVITIKEVRRFHIALRQSGNGMMYKLTDASYHRVNTALKKAGPGSFREFDYETQEVVILRPDKIWTLAEYANEKGWKKEGEGT